MLSQGIIIARATAAGTGAIALIRLSGPGSIELVSRFFSPLSKRNIIDCDSHTLHLGHIYKDHSQQPLDEVLVSLFKAPRSYTGEEVVEISCHGSNYIQQEILQLFVSTNECRMAEAGELTLRAFLNGKMGLDQAEAVADLIASENEASHRIAMSQMRGGFHHQINDLRKELIEFASLIELELDFSTEDVAFADRTQLQHLLEKLKTTIRSLLDSFGLGNVLKNGVPIAIVGAPNVGKSTLLNALLNEERAIVSSIAGTTRDTIEDEISIDGIRFRFIDTAGIRQTSDEIEQIGIHKTFEKMQQAALVLYLLEAKDYNEAKKEEIHEFCKTQQIDPENVLVVLNKIDIQKPELTKTNSQSVLFISAQNGDGIDDLRNKLSSLVQLGNLKATDIVVSNSRHFNALNASLTSVMNVQEGLTNELSGDLMAIDLREAIHHLGEITGSVTTDDLLGSIFSNFCIGK
jgi:tRNA modification GTPase